MEKVYIVRGIPLGSEEKIWGVSASRAVAEATYLEAEKELASQVRGHEAANDPETVSLEKAVWDGKGLPYCDPSEYEDPLPKGGRVLAFAHTGMAFDHWVHIMLAEIPLIPEKPAGKKRKTKK